MTGRESSFLDAADRIGRRLCRDALWAEGRCNWLGWHLVPQNNAWIPAWKSLGWPVYDGIAGVCWFLAELLRFRGDEIERATLAGALHQLRRMTAVVDPSSCGGYHGGLAGIPPVCLMAAEVLGDAQWTDFALSIYERLSGLACQDSQLDLLSGSAGIIVSLLEGAARFGRDDFIEAADRHGRSLLAHARRSDDGWSWETCPPGQASDHLLGYSHGAGGIAAALLELHLATGDSACAHAVAEALRYERSRFSPANRNWPDFRALPAIAGQPASSEPRYPVAWCHGAPGLGISRLRIRELQPEPELDQEIETALETTITTLPYVSAPGQGNYSLCHGAAGNAEFLLLASQLLGRPELRQTAESVGHAAIAQYHNTDMPWPCGIAGAGENPSLMVGFAGIGHFFLRLYAPEQVRSALLLRSDSLRASAGERRQASTAVGA